MPSASHVAQTRQIGNFYNALNLHSGPMKSGRGIQGLLGISNTSASASHQLNDIRAPQPGIDYCKVNIEESVSDEGAQQKNSGGQAAAGGVCAAMKRHPWTTGVVLFLAAGTVASLAYKTMPNSLPSMEKMPEALPAPERLHNYWRADPDNVFNICQRVIDDFPQMRGRQVSSISLSGLNSIKAETTRMVSAARNMAQEEGVETSELMDAARCSGVRLMRDKVGAMISDLETMRSGLLENDGMSIDAAIDIIRLRIRAGAIDERLAVLRDMRRNLYDVTVILNRRIFSNIG